MVSPILWSRTRRDARRIDPGELAAAVQLRERCRTRCPASTLAPIFPPDCTLEASAAKRRCGSAAQFSDRRMRATRPSPAALSPEASRPSRNRVVMTAPTRSAFTSTIILPRQVPPAGIPAAPKPIDAANLVPLYADKPPSNVAPPVPTPAPFSSPRNCPPSTARPAARPIAKSLNLHRFIGSARF